MLLNDYMYDFMYNVWDEMQHVAAFVTNLCWQHMQLVLPLPLFTFSTLLTSTVPVFEIRQMIIDWTWALISFIAVKLKHVTEVRGVQGFVWIRWMVWGHPIIQMDLNMEYGIQDIIIIYLNDILHIKMIIVTITI